MLHAISVSVILFLTTPAVIVDALKRVDILKLHQLEISKTVPFGGTISTYLPPLLILLVNQIILML